MAGLPALLSDRPGEPLLARVAPGDPLSELLRDIRVARSLQYCFAPEGDFVVDASPAPFRPPGSVSFHIVIEGDIWVRLGGEEVRAGPGDVIVFARGVQHWIGAGSGGRLYSPGDALPPLPWSHVPQVAGLVTDAAAPQAEERGTGRRARILCGFLEAKVLDFPPLVESLPEMMVARVGQGTDWLGPAVSGLAEEVARPTPGGMALVQRLTEVIFIEIIRRQLARAAAAGRTGWLGALADPVVVRALRLLHGAPAEGWTQASLARRAGVSKTVLCARFATAMGRSPMRYLREWRLYLASAELAGESTAALGPVSERAGYATEAAFCRAFARQYGLPPARWRARARAERG